MVRPLYTTTPSSCLFSVGSKSHFSTITGVLRGLKVRPLSVLAQFPLRLEYRNPLLKCNWRMVRILKSDGTFRGRLANWEGFVSFSWGWIWFCQRGLFVVKRNCPLRLLSLGHVSAFFSFCRESKALSMLLDFQPIRTMSQNKPVLYYKRLDFRYCSLAIETWLRCCYLSIVTDL